MGRNTSLKTMGAFSARIYLWGSSHTPALLYLQVLGQTSWLHRDDVLVGAQLPSDHFMVVKLELDPHSWGHIHFGLEVFHVQGIAPEKSAVGLFGENKRRRKSFVALWFRLRLLILTVTSVRELQFFANTGCFSKLKAGTEFKSMTIK